MKKITIITALTASLLMGCEKSINFPLKNASPKLVVEATIENDQYPTVILTHSTNFFSQITPDILENSFVHQADITISDGLVTQKLKEYSRPVIGNFNYYYYTVDSSSLATAFKGQLNHNYSLRIAAEGQEYTATTTIPQLAKVIRNLTWKQAPDSDTSKVVLLTTITDPPGFGNYSRYFTKTNSYPFMAPLNSVFDDLFIDGTTYTVQIEPGVDRNDTKTHDNHYFNRGDTVTLKLSDIDKATFDFWRTMEYSYASVGNPFSTPAKVIGNISNNALGYFGGYASQYRTIIIPK